MKSREWLAFRYSLLVIHYSLVCPSEQSEESIVMNRE